MEPRTVQNAHSAAARAQNHSPRTRRDDADDHHRDHGRPRREPSAPTRNDRGPELALVTGEAGSMSDDTFSSKSAGVPDGVRIIRRGELDPNTPQTPGMARAEAISYAKVGARKIWAGTVVVHPNARTGAHHHGELET